MRVRNIALAITVGAFLSAGVHGGEKVRPVLQGIKAADGVTIVCQSCGKGDTALVFLHGWCGDHEYWKNQVEAFAADYRIVALDQAGHGLSGKDRKEWTVASLARDVETVVKELNLKRVILVGHSMGGPVGLMAAKRMPGTVVALIGVDTLQNAEHKMPEDVRKKFLMAFEKDFQGTIRSGFELMVNAKADLAVKKWLIDRAAAQDPKMAVPLMVNLQNLDTRQLLKQAKVPVRCINSGGGFAFHTPTDIKVNKKYADYDAILIDAVGHYPMLEKQAEFNQKLREVLKEFKVKSDK